MKILIANNYLPGIGDFIYFSFILMYDFHKKFNCEIYYYNNDELFRKNTYYMNFISSFSDIFSVETDIYNKSYDIVVSCKNFFNDISMYNIKYNKIYYYHFGKLFNYNQSYLQYIIQNIAPNYEMKLDNKCFENIHQYMKNKFVIRNKFNLQKNTITIAIGTNSQRFNGLTDKTLQKNISKLIHNNKNIHFCLVGFSHQIICDEFKNCLQKNYSHVLNLIDKDTDLFDVIDIIQSSKIFVTRSSGLLHIAGLFNHNIIYLREYNHYYMKKIFDMKQIKKSIIRIKNYGFRLIKDFFRSLFNILLLLINRFVFNHDPPHKDVITYSIQNEETHPYYYENWTPISLNYVRINEYKYYDYFYNNFDYVYFYLSKAIQSVNDQ